jgi:hypothetical protein
MRKRNVMRVRYFLSIIPSLESVKPKTLQFISKQCLKPSRVKTALHFLPYADLQLE